jgi:orotate phosphoribosyltransferase
MTDAPLRDATIEELFERSGALLDGHFLLKSGRHAGRYLEKFLVLQHPAIAVEIGRRMAELLAAVRPTLVVGPTTGGVLLAHEVARQLGGGVRGIFAEPVATAVGRCAAAGRSTPTSAWCSSTTS